MIVTRRRDRETAKGVTALKIGLALSGGGVRAAVFHLGVLARLAADGLLEQVTFISTVSGGSIVIGLVYGLGGNRWPDSMSYLASIVPAARVRLTTTSIQRVAALETIRRPWLLVQGRAKVIADALQIEWGIVGQLKNVPREPRWVINATTYESGKNWRFMPQRMGDYVVGYVAEPSIPLADAVAASAAFPGLIGSLVLDTQKFTWSRYTSGQLVPAEQPQLPKLHLWDGGVYDNLGVEALFKPGKADGVYRDEYSFLIVSDASAPFNGGSTPAWKSPLRLIDIATGQIRALRSRMLIDHFVQNPDSGAYLRIGNSASYLLQEAGVDEVTQRLVAESCLSKLDVAAAASVGTHLRQLSESEFDRLYRHGWEVTDCTLSSRHSTQFEYRCFGQANS